MFDDVPVRVWLLLALVLTAYQPVVVLLSARKSRSDKFGQPPGRRMVILNIIALFVLTMLAIFIYTPQAELLAANPFFWPAIMAIGGVLALAGVGRGLIAGRITPISRGSFGPYKRYDAPRRFWVSIAWNAMVGIAFAAVGIGMARDAQRSADDAQCYEKQEDVTVEQRLAACTRLVEESGNDGATARTARGVAYQDAVLYRQALADYDEAIRIDPDDAIALFNRGLIHEELAKYSLALADYETALRVEPADADIRTRRDAMRAKIIEQPTQPFSPPIITFPLGMTAGASLDRRDS